MTGAACWRADGTPIGMRGRRRSRAPACRVRVSGSAAGGAAYFRTQITRTTDAFASADPPDALTPLAFKNSRTVSAGTSAACAAGAAFGGPATITGFNCDHAGEFAVAVHRGRAGKAERRRQATADRRRCSCGLDAAHRLAAALILRIGDAGQIDRRLCAPPARLSGFSPRAP